VEPGQPLADVLELLPVFFDGVGEEERGGLGGWSEFWREVRRTREKEGLGGGRGEEEGEKEEEELEPGQPLADVLELLPVFFDGVGEEERGGLGSWFEFWGVCGEGERRRKRRRRKRRREKEERERGEEGEGRGERGKEAVKRERRERAYFCFPWVLRGMYI
jgi:hypothetical protein